jgi:hypothetical protein
MKDFSYMFYPGDVLRDTQFFSDAQKGCYLSILCCHIENIRISYDLLMIITRSLSEYEKTSFLKIFDKDDEGFFLNWAVNSIEKRSAFIESRSNNKAGRKKNESLLESKKEIIKESYDLHMVNVNENKKEKEYKSELEKIFNEFLEMRKKIRKPATEKAIELLKNKIRKLSNSDEQLAIKIIEQSIMNSWQDVFELRQDFKKQIIEQKVITKRAL